jgi:hypothetical protein
MWGKGFTNTRAIHNITNVGAYLSSYLGNICIDDQNKDEIFSSVYKSGQDIIIEEKEVLGDNGEKISRKFIKGGRLGLYPCGTNIYRCSRGIKKPEPQYMTYSEVKETLIGDKAPDFARTIVIEGEKNDGGIKRTLNSITYEHYNLKRERKNLIK